MDKGRQGLKPRNTATRQEAAAGEADVEDITLSEQIYRRLRRDIMHGAFPAGGSLRLEVLKQRYGSSFSPIREALNRLRSERMVVSTAARGFRIAPLSLDEMWDACETRILIECEALRRSLQHADDEWEGEAVAALHKLSLAARRARAESVGDEAVKDALEARHWEFHRALLAACRSPYLLELSSQLYAQTERYRRPARAGVSAYDAERDVDAEHAELLAHCQRRDVEGAVRLLAAHYRKTAESIQALLQPAARQQNA